MATRRTYDDRCGVARALDVVGERWSLLIVRELLLGPKRYTDIKAGLPRATPNVLSDRLRELETAGVLRRRALGPPARVTVYELTSRGHELEPVILALGRWGSATPVRPGTEMSVDSHALALRTLFSADAAAGAELRVDLAIEDDELAASVSEGGFELRRGRDAAAGATIATDRPALRRLLWEGLSLGEATTSGAATIDGDVAVAETFLRLFPRPRAAPSPSPADPLEAP